MKVAVLGTGTVGRTLGAAIAHAGHDITLGTRNVETLLTSAETGPMTPQPFSAWLAEHPKIGVATFADAAAGAEIVFNATSGTASLDALEAAGDAALSGKILIDVANPLDFSAGFPPTLTVANTDSLGERIQRRFPSARVVKTLNTVTAALMVEPGAVAGGDHSMFVCGDDPSAKEAVADILRGWFGWTDVIDAGDITAARGLEMYLPLWVRLMGSLGTIMFNVKVAR